MVDQEYVVFLFGNDFQASIESADPSNEAVLAGQLSIEIGRERGADISSLYRFSLANQHEVSTNQQALQTFLNTQ